jgi:salicylate hydroxylase
MARSRTILIAGAGIGGLAAAIALAKAGFRPLVMERTARLEEIGAGIQLTPNASRALDRIGVLDAVKKNAIEAKNLIVASGETGVELARSPLHCAAMRFGAPWLMTLRADLHRALQTAARDLVDIELELGTEVTDFAVHARGATALTLKGKKTDEQLGLGLIGADGLWSKVRARQNGDRPPVLHDLVAARALIPTSALPASFAEPDIRLWLGGDAHIVHYPVSGGAQINVVIVFRDKWRGSGWDTHMVPAQLPGHLHRWSALPRKLMAAARSYSRWTLADREPIRKWGEGCVTLLGDAAHPMLPFLAQGAGAALEDAVCLARHLTHHPSIADAMRAYEKERAPRTAQMQRAARLSSRAYHASGILRWARDLKLRWDADKLVDRYGWIYRYRPT